MRNETLRVIEILWSGPLERADLETMNGPTDRGVLAVYGSHPVFGADALLYLDGTESGRREGQPVERFSDRVQRFGPWFDTLPTPPEFYVGRLGGTAAPELADWTTNIDRATRLLTFFHAPPWNGRFVDHHRVSSPTAVLNLGRRHRLSMEVSTLWDQSPWGPGATDWKPFGVSDEG